MIDSKRDSNPPAEHHRSQPPCRCELDWGLPGASEAASRGDIVVLVDTLSFSTCVVAAVHGGAVIYPCADRSEGAELARSYGAELAVRRVDVPLKGRFSLSPLTYLDITPGTRIVLPSPNGSACSQAAAQAGRLFLGAFVNAAAVASVVSQELRKIEQEKSVTVIACGERVTSEGTITDPMRFAAEDYLGAGAILSYLPFDKSPLARRCEAAYLHSRDRIDRILLNCQSGRECRSLGFGRDVEFASRLNSLNSVPVLREGHFERIEAQR
ncbi:MAG TPA: 2-phosphosulfolactate phosphatase [Candidatus Deferrimicrobium sp.]|nr:2-phosphosulfolactate phosphatase [Candidatus Deferrimicrobium sp.]